MLTEKMYRLWSVVTGFWFLCNSCSCAENFLRTGPFYD